MKQKQKILGVGIALLMVGTFFNVYDAVNEYGVLESMLHPRVEAQASGINGSVTHITKGKQKTTSVQCKITSTSTTSTNSGTTSSSGGHWGGSVGGTWAGIGAQVVGGGNAGGSGSNSQGSTTTTIVEKEFEADMLTCLPLQGYEKTSCTEYDPCPGFHSSGSESN